MLQSLARMPAEMSSESRRQLLNAVTDLFLLDGDPSEAAKAHYGEIALQSLSYLGAEERKQYADNVASTPVLPHEVAVSLAGDADSEVARLVLRLSPVLSDGDLAAIAMSQTQAHLLAIAGRAWLAESVTDVLVERGDSSVLETVSANEGARFSDDGFDRLLERGGDNPAIGDALGRRTDLSPQRIDRVLRIVAQVAEPTGDGHPTEGAALARQARRQRRELRSLMAELQAGTRTLDEIVTMLAEEDRAVHLSQLLATSAGIAEQQALRVLLQRDSSGIAVTCRGIGLHAAAFAAVLDLRARRLHSAAETRKQDAESYAQLDAATAERTMRFLKLKTRIG